MFDITDHRSLIRSIWIPLSRRGQKTTTAKSTKTKTTTLQPRLDPLPSLSPSPSVRLFLITSSKETTRERERFLVKKLQHAILQKYIQSIISNFTNISRFCWKNAKLNGQLIVISRVKSACYPKSNISFTYLPIVFL